MSKTPPEIKAKKAIINRQWQECKKELGIPQDDHHLTGARMANILRWTGQRIRAGETQLTFPMHYELAHKFVVEDIVHHMASRNLQLTPQDLKQIKGLFGRVNYNPPLAERMRMANAARELASRPNHKRIFTSLKTELQSLLKKYGTSLHFKEQGYSGEPVDYSDMFSNTTGNHITRTMARSKKCKTFKLLADQIELHARNDFPKQYEQYAANRAKRAR